MLTGLRNALVIILTTALLASCVGVPEPSNGVSYNRYERARNRQIQANNDRVVGTAIIAGVAGALIGGAIASNNHRSYNRGGYYGPRYERRYYRRNYYRTYDGY